MRKDLKLRLKKSLVIKIFYVRDSENKDIKYILHKIPLSSRYYRVLIF